MNKYDEVVGTQGLTVEERTCKWKFGEHRKNPMVINWIWKSWYNFVTAKMLQYVCFTPVYACVYIYICTYYGFSSGHEWMWELDYKESLAPKNWCFWSVVLEKTLESPLDCKEIQPVHPKADQSWVFIGRTVVEAETPILWPPDVKRWLIWKDPDAGKDWRWAEKRTTGTLSIRYADDTTLMAESEEELNSLLMKVKVESENLA